MKKKNLATLFFFHTSSKVHGSGSDGLLTLTFKASPTQILSQLKTSDFLMLTFNIICYV